MSDRTMQADPSDDALVSAIDRWSAQAGLSAVGVDAPILVLDESAVRVLHASPAAAGLRAGLARADGRVAPGINLSAQAGMSARVGEPPRLVRLRLDPRGIAAPATCLVARLVVEAATTVLIVAPVGPVPVLRPLAGVSSGALPSQPTPPIEPAPAPETVAPPAAPRTDGRIVWQSDEADILRRVSGDETVARALTGRSWPDLFAGGTMEGEPLSAAIAGRETFRALRAVVLPGGAETIEIDWSGSPTARSHQPFAGFAGFGLIRARHPIEVQPAQAPPIETEDTGSAPASAEGAALSANEHAAFREIARSLGVRFAGDDGASGRVQDEASEGSSEPTITTPRGSVTPFPTSLRTVPVGPSAGDLLDGLPVGALIHRGGAILFANPHAIAMSGCPDLPTLRTSNAFADLIRETQPDEGGIDEVISIRTATGAVVRVTLDRTDIAWEGARATLLLVRPAATAAPSEEPDPQEMPHDRAALDAARADAACVLDSLPDGILTLDEGGRVLTSNARADALLGRKALAIVGHGLAELFPRDAEPAVAAAIERGGRVGAGEAHVVLRDGDGTPVPVLLRVVRLPEGGARFCATMQDRSEAEAGEAEIARQADVAASRKADFLAKVSHEIRTPLNNILGFADVMLSESQGPLGAERHREYLQDIHDSGSHVLRVVDDLLDLAGIEAGRVDLRFTEIPLNDLVSGCIALMQPQAARDRIVVRTSFAPDPTTLVADERSMRQAALNVIANAIRFTEAGGQVIVSTTIAERGEVALRVRDTGIGMTTEEVEDALHPFRRIGVSGPAPGGGTGLGLTLTKALVEANHGRFRITSRKHEGTLVEMVFPVAEARRA